MGTAAPVIVQMVTAAILLATALVKLVTFPTVKELVHSSQPGLTQTMNVMPLIVIPVTATALVPVIFIQAEKKATAETVNSVMMLTLAVNMSAQATTLMTTVVPAVKCVMARAVVLMTTPNVQPLTVTPEPVLLTLVISTLVERKVPAVIVNSAMTLTLTVNTWVQAMTLMTTVVPAVKCVMVQVAVLITTHSVQPLTVIPELVPLIPVISTLVERKVPAVPVNSATMLTLIVNMSAQAMTLTTNVMQPIATLATATGRELATSIQVEKKVTAALVTNATMVTQTAT